MDGCDFIIYLDYGQLIENLSQAIDIVSYLDRTIPILVFSPLHHHRNTSIYVLMMADILKLEPSEKNDLYILALIHDAGMVSTEFLPEKLNDLHSIEGHALNTKRKKDTLHIGEIMIEHCILSESLASKLHFNASPSKVIYYHHENYDGTGYFGIKGNEIPLYSQILRFTEELERLCDVADLDKHIDMMSTYLNNSTGTLLDPTIVSAANKLISKWSYSLFQEYYCIRPKIIKSFTALQIKTLAEGFMKIIDLKSNYTFRHSELTSKIAVQIGRLANLDLVILDRIYISACLHDIGKLYVSKSILEKPEQLTTIEREIIKEHSSLSEKLFINVMGFENYGFIIGQHHERLDGSGYPRGLHSNQICIEAKIIGVADVIAALVETRPYRNSLNYDEIYGILKTEFSEGLDPQFVEYGLHVLKETLKSS